MICYARVWTTHEEHLVVLIVGQTGWNWLCSFKDMQILMLCEFGMKVPIYVNFGEVLGVKME